MAKIKNFPNNVDEYIGAETVMKWLHGRTSGVFAADNNLAVTSQGGMNLAVSDGVGWIANSEGDGTVFWNDIFKSTGTQLLLNLELADAANPRIDRIIVTWETIDYTDKPEIKVLKGTPASAPSPPALTRTGNIWQISLAQIYVGAAVSAITAANITDERLDSEVCGLVTGSIKIDSSMAYAQFKEFLALIERELSNLNAGTEVMLKTVYDPNNDGVIDGLDDAITTANAALPKSGGAMTGTLSDVTAAQVRNTVLTTVDQTVGASSSYPNGTYIDVYEA